MEEDATVPINRIQVAVRVRPVLPYEDPHQVAATCSADGTRVQVQIPPKEYSKPTIAVTARPDGKAYEFDACLNGSTSQGQLFDVCGMEELVEAAVDGYNVTIFAFGQTGSGKTHTMLGPRLGRLGDGLLDPEQAARAGQHYQQRHHHHHHPASGSSGEGGGSGSVIGEEEGVVLRCLHQQYKLLEAWAAEHPGGVWGVDVSCCEIYNETITDMLGHDKTRQLQVRQDPRQGSFYVEGLAQAPCSSLSAAVEVISAAMTWRHTRSHKLNNYSSRSHCLITLAIRRQEPGEGGEAGLRRCGKLALVDLAGSERLKETGNSDKEAVRETGHINKSLFTLGQVLAALSARSDLGVPVHIPYRDSKLTQLLWEGLRGDGRALMLACLGPLRQQAEESLNTLHFAGMALRIKSQPIMLLDPADRQVLDLKTTIRTLKEDLKHLAGALHQLSTGAELGIVLKALPPTLLQDALRAGPGGAYSAPTGATRSPGSGTGRRQAAGSSGGARRPAGPLSDGFLPAVRSSSPTRSYHGPGSPSRARNNGSREQLHRHSWNMFSTQPNRAPSRHLGVTGDSGTFGSLRASFPVSPSRARGQGGFMGSSSSYSPMGDWGVNRAWTGTSQHRAFGGMAGVPASVSHNLDGMFGGGAGLRSSTQQQQLALPGLVGGSIPSSTFPELAALESQFQHSLAARAGLLPEQDMGPGMPLAAMSPVMGSSASQLTARHHHHQQQQQAHSKYMDALNRSSNPGCSAVSQMLAAYQQQQTQAAAQETKQMEYAAAAAAVAAAAGEPPPPPPEPKALNWAERNLWFGTDTEMTEFAYQVHDSLVNQEGMDASSDTYYNAIEQRVKDKFADKWDSWQKVAAEAAAAAAAADKAVADQATAAQAAAQAQRVQQIQALRGFTGSPVRSSQNFTSFRVPLKEPTPAVAPSGAALPGAAFAQQMLGLYQQTGNGPSSSSSHPSSPPQQLPHSPLSGANLDGTGALAAGDAPSTSGRGLTPEGGSMAVAAAAGSGLLPRLQGTAGAGAGGIGQHLQGTWSQQRLLGGTFATAPDMGRGPPASGISYLSPAAGQLLATTSASYFDGSGPLTAGVRAPWGAVGPAHGMAVTQTLRSSFMPGGKSLDELQGEYAAARQVVMTQLRQAKDEAERERRAILLRINRALAAGRWA